MQIYLVGGAVRDQLLGRQITERDWVVVGATPEQMLTQGYVQVGKDFPVFLHPKTHEEYALARTERKTGKGHTEFTCFSDPSVTLEEDLKRRDLTINAIAQTPAGELIDPYGGKQDLKNHILRHVSEAFAEDPLRVLRVARFAAKFPQFTVHSTTITLMQSILKAGELDALTVERVWNELEQALAELAPHRFFEVLSDCGALSHLFPEIAQVMPAAKQALINAAKLTQDGATRFAALTYNLNVTQIKSLCNRYHIPNKYRQLALLVNNFKQQFKEAENLRAQELLGLLEKTDAFRRAERFTAFLLACSANNAEGKQFQLLQNAQRDANQIDIKSLLQQKLDNEALKNAIHNQRLIAIKKDA